MREYIGSRVQLEDGSEDRVLSAFAAGKHVQFKMESGKTLLDIHLNPKIMRLLDEVEMTTFSVNTEVEQEETVEEGDFELFDESEERLD